MELSSSPAESSAPPVKISPLLSLPPELRLLIYNHIFTHVRQRNNRTRENETPCKGISMLLTCRRLHDEAAPVLYGMQSFEYSSGLGMRPYVDLPTEFLTQIGATNRGYVRSLALDWNSDVEHIGELLMEEGGPVRETLLPWPVEEVFRRARLKDEAQALYAWRICRTLEMLAGGCLRLETLEVRVPGRHEVALGPLVRLRNFFSRRDVREALRNVRVSSRFSVGRTLDYVAAEEVARTMGARRVKMIWGSFVCVSAAGRSRGTNSLSETLKEMQERGWEVKSDSVWFETYAEKTLIQ